MTLDVPLRELDAQRLYQALSETILVNTLTDVREFKKSCLKKVSAHTFQTKNDPPIYKDFNLPDNSDVFGRMTDSNLTHWRHLILWVNDHSETNMTHQDQVNLVKIASYMLVTCCPHAVDDVRVSKTHIINTKLYSHLSQLIKTNTIVCICIYTI